LHAMSLQVNVCLYNILPFAFISNVMHLLTYAGTRLYMSKMKIFLVTMLVLGTMFTVFSQPISMISEKDGVWIKDGVQKVFFYQKTPNSLDGKYARSNYLHPVFGLDGEILTEDFPADHFHHRGIFWTWHQLWKDSVRLSDPWMCDNFLQEVTKIRFIKGLNLTGILVVDILWKSPLWLKNGVQSAVIHENTRITVFPVSNGCRRLDFRIELKALENGIRIGGSEDEKGYGGFSVRMLLVPGMKFTSAGTDIVPQNLGMIAGAEMDISGRVGEKGKLAGIMMVCRSSNPDYPEKWIIRKEKSMQNCAWPGNRTVGIKVSKPLVLNYSIIIHRGDVSNSGLLPILKSILEESK